MNVKTQAMKNSTKWSLWAAFLLCISLTRAQGEYNLIVEGFDWGAAVNKVVLSKTNQQTTLDAEHYSVIVSRGSAEAAVNPSTGSREVIATYASDHNGTFNEEGEFITLVLAVAPSIRIASPIVYTPGKGNNWVDYKVSITNSNTLETWNTEKERFIPLVDEFDLSGSFSHGSVTMSYASFAPRVQRDKHPLIIWLHGGGEGGTDPTIPLLANRAANYASADIQDYFEGAHVLVPQSPTRWMDSGNGSTRGQVDDIYYEALKELFDDYVSKHPDIDTDRIYVGGCSNGGYMSLKLILEYPKYFAAGYISALAYYGEFLSEKQAKSIRNVPIWFVHSKDDPVTQADKTVIPVHQKLMDAKAKNVHLSLYDNVTDISNLLGGENFHYPGHWSWIYSHANKSQRDVDGAVVKVKGVPVTLMQWMATMKK